MEAIIAFRGTLIPLPRNDIDTDQIIPARFLKTTNKVGLGQQAFFDWRYDGAGEPRADFPLNQPQYAGASVLVTGNNFGCGSSREHAPWALLGAGLKAVVSTDFADIFRNNALKNGLLPVVVDEETQQQLLSLAEEDPTAEIAIDLEAQMLTLPDGRAVSFPIDGFSRHCLMNGVDQLGFLLALDSEIVRYEGDHLPRVNLAATEPPA